MRYSCILLFCTYLFGIDFTEEKLFDLSNEIRGSNIECNGEEYISAYQEYLDELNVDFNDKDLYKKPITNYDDYINYFKYWAYQSIGNFKLYNDFNEESNNFCNKYLADFKKNSSNYKKNCEIFIQRFGKRAFGAIKSKIHLKDMYEDFIELDSSLIIDYLNEKSPTNYELNFLLKIALLTRKDLEVIDFLLSKGANINTGYESALFYSIGYYDAMKLLIKKGANVNYVNSFGKSPIFYAVEYNDFESLKILVDNGAKINIRLIDNQDELKTKLPYYISTCSYIHPSKTLFMHAASFANKKILEYLISFKIDYKNTDLQGYNALDYAIMHSNNEAVEILKKLGLKENI